MLKKIAISLCQILLMLIVVVGLLIACGAYAERTAAGKAAESCRQIAPGVPSVGIRERAMALGAVERKIAWLKNPGGEEIYVAIFTGATPLSRHICQVTSKGGRVISSELSYLD